MEEQSSIPGIEVFRGSRAASFEFGLVLEARGIAYECVQFGDAWVLHVDPGSTAAALEELRRYAAERGDSARAPDFIAFPGSGIGAASYGVVLVVVAYCAGIHLFGVDWLAAGAIISQPDALREWWRPLTALTLHLDPEHLLGNLLFGVGIGILAGRTLGPGVAWLCILLAGALGNALDMGIAPFGHRAAGASTAVFAGLGLLSGFGWGQRLTLRARRLYRWGPLFAGVCLLALLGAGGEHLQVDVLGHLLGFLVGVIFGWAVERTGLTRQRGGGLQFGAGALALLSISGAWLFALRAV